MSRPRRPNAPHARPPATGEQKSGAPPTPLSHPAMLAALLVAAGGVLASVTFRLFETDFWQHLTVGKAIWTLHRVPTTQLWSWASYGDPEMNSAWVFRALIWKFWSIGGVWGLFVWRWVTTLGAVALLWVAARRMGVRGFAALIIPVACALAYRSRSQIRPETLVAVYLALTIWILETRRQGGRDHTAWLPAIALAWANTHLSYFLGFILLGIHTLGALRAARGRGAKSAPGPRRLIVIGLIALAVSFLNPFGARALWQPFDFALHWRNEPMFQGIGELQRLPFVALQWPGVAFVLVLWPLLIVWRAVRRRFDLVEALAFVIFASLAWSSVRFLGYVSLVSLPYLARGLDEWMAARRWPAWSRSPWPRAALASAAVLALGLPPWTAGGTGVAVGVDKRFVSERACDFIAAENIKGRGFNHFHLGGYMLWRFWPDRERLPFATIHPEAMRREDRLGYEVARTQLAGWKALDQRHHFDYALLYRRQYGGDQLQEALDQDNDFTLVFLDDNAAVFVRWNGPLASVAARHAYHAVPAGRASIAAFGAACERDSALRERARTELARQAEASEFNAMANSIRATLDLMDGRLAEAEQHLREAMAVDRNLPRAHERLGMIALAAGRPADAVRELTLAAAEKPVSQGVHFALGNAWARTGDRAKAIEQYRAELSMNPGHALARDSLRTLESEH